jgi:AraC-like DNA-binding protein
LRVQDYADLQFLHVNYLWSVISRKPSKSVSAWIADKTVAEARGMLQNPALTIQEIAIRLGFLEAPHFSNYFKNTLRKARLNTGSCMLGELVDWIETVGVLIQQ